MQPTNRIKLLERLNNIDITLKALLTQKVVKEYYTVDEFASMVRRTNYTVRQWCNLGAIYAERTMTQTGPSRRWAISHEEYLRYQREGLRPPRRRQRPPDADE